MQANPHHMARCCSPVEERRAADALKSSRTVASADFINYVPKLEAAKGRLNSLTAIARAIYQDAHGPRTVRHLGPKIPGADADGRTAQDREAVTPDFEDPAGSTTMDSLSDGLFSRTHPWGLTHPTVDQCPIMPRIIAGIPSRTNPLTSSACSRIASVIRGSPEVSVTTTPLAVSVSSRR